MRDHRILLITVIALLAGCKRHPQPEYFPLDAGAHWEYRLHEVNPLVDGKRALTMDNLGPRDREGRRYWLRRSSEGNEYWLSADGAVQRVAQRNWLAPDPTFDKSAQTVLPAKLEVGVEWDATTRPYILERAIPFRERFWGDESKSVELRMRLAALDDTVQTPAGRFDHCLRVEGQGLLYVLADARYAASEVPVTQTEWYAPGIGLVKLHRVEALRTEQIVGGEVTMELTRFEP